MVHVTLPCTVLTEAKVLPRQIDLLPPLLPSTRYFSCTHTPAAFRGALPCCLAFPQAPTAQAHTGPSLPVLLLRPPPEAPCQPAGRCNALGRGAAAEVAGSLPCGLVKHTRGPAS